MKAGHFRDAERVINIHGVHAAYARSMPFSLCCN
jgi:hypothetical protein